MNIKSYIRTIPDYPKPGIQFRDITTLLKDKDGLSETINALLDIHGGESIDAIAGIESRGFIFGTALAVAMEIGFIPIRKKGKLPSQTFQIEYQLEYGVDTLEIHVDALDKGQRVLVVDDLLATGGTASAAVDLVRRTGAIVAATSFVVELPDLGGRNVLFEKNVGVSSLCKFEGA